MITAGIDLASQPDRTVACAIEWSGGRARVVELRGGVDDDRFAPLIRLSDWTRIDVPLGDSLGRLASAADTME